MLNQAVWSFNNGRLLVFKEFIKIATRTNIGESKRVVVVVSEPFPLLSNGRLSSRWLLPIAEQQQLRRRSYCTYVDFYHL